MDSDEDRERMSSDLHSDSDLRAMSFTEFEVTPRDLSHVDIQGIPWKLSEMTRDAFRQSRNEEYMDFERRKGVRLWRGDPSYSDIVRLFSFKMMNRMDNCTINHFQLRHLLSSPTNRSVYFPHLNRVMHWNPVMGKSDVAVEYHDAILPRISALKATRDFIAVGGLGGELMVIPVGETRAKWFCLVSRDTNNIVTNISDISTDKEKILISSNDAIVRKYSLNALKILQAYRFDWSINASASSPDANALCVVGDSSETVLLDHRMGKEFQRLTGHTDFSFSCAWSSDGQWLVTGNQDHSAHIYDTRFMRSHNGAYKVIKSEMAAVRCLEFSPDSSCLAVMEADDFVHLYDVTSDFKERQTIDFFGETAGIGFTPDSEHFYIGIASIERGGIFEFQREHPKVYNRFRSILL